jgi:phage terminase Nu1 subunit (DNA packaging protein)
MPKKAAPVTRDEVLNQKQLAARLDLDPRQIRNLTKQGMPTTYLRESGTERGYVWPACFHWYLRFKLEAETAKFSAPARLQAAQIREMEARAAKRELELAQAHEQLLPVAWLATRERRLLEQVATEFRTFGQRIRQDLVQLPDVHAVDRVLATRVDEAIVNCRTALLGGADAELTDSPDDAGDDDSA